MSEQHSAILFFSLTASEESKMKTFVPDGGQKTNLAVANSLIHHTYRVAKKTKLAIFRSSGQEQYGANFGERLANAIESVFDKGYQKVIVIGNDCPELSTKLLLNANQELNHKSLVLGPATDGGIYLLGIQKRAYKRQAFLKMAWQSEALQESWKQYTIQFKQELSWLNRLADIDNISDLQHYIARSANNLLKSYLISILASYQYSTTRYISHTYNKQLSINTPLRAPPYIFL